VGEKRLRGIDLHTGASQFTGSQAGTAPIFIADFGKIHEYKNENLT
jgi:hypothetical protein